MKYGGINTAQSLDQIEEATAYVTPPVVYTKLQIAYISVATLIKSIIKLLPITLLLMAIAWGVCFVFTV